MTIKTYRSPLAFRQGLEERLRAAATPQDPLRRLRQRLVFDRFLARAFAVFPDAYSGHRDRLDRSS